MNFLISTILLLSISQISLADTLSCDVVFKHKLGTIKHKLSFIKNGNTIARTVTFTNGFKDPLILECELERSPKLNFETIICTSEENSIIRTEKYVVYANHQVEGTATIDRTEALEKGAIDRVNKFTGTINNSYETREMDNIKNCRLED